MISQDQIDEWIHEVEDRPQSGGLIVRLVSMRLKALTERNEELLAENIELRSGARVEEYERKIANLEYQLNLLRRQFVGDFSIGSTAAIQVDQLCFLVYNTKGQVLRAVVPINTLDHGKEPIKFKDPQALQADGQVRIIVTHQHEEVVFVFDSGRTSTMAVDQITPCDSLELDWKDAYSTDPHAGEQLVAAYPIGKMSLFDYILQTSRRGCTKRMMRSSFEQHLAKNYIGTGIKQPPDKTFALTLSNKQDLLAIATHEGYVSVRGVEELSYTIEEMLKLSTTDYLVSAFVLNQKPYILIVTNLGKTIHRELSWLEPAVSNKSKGQAVFSSSRRDAGTRVVGAAALDQEDWGAVLHANGTVSIHKAATLFAEGSIATNSELVEFTTFTL